jgi:hypothetical protein
MQRLRETEADRKSNGESTDKHRQRGEEQEERHR